MKIAILGYGKMGKMIEKLSISRGHEIIYKSNHFTENDAKTLHNNPCVAIEFSEPKSAYQNIKLCLNQNIPIVSGTTGWLTELKDIITLCKQQNGSFLYSSNFSIGVNIFFHINKQLAKLMSEQPSYEASMKEIHHIHKKDAPSGTAITLAEGIISEHPQYETWLLEQNKPNSIPIHAIRENEVPGTHIVQYQSTIDKVEIKHEAVSREGFAHGAISAAQWLQDKVGYFTMDDMLGL